MDLFNENNPLMRVLTTLSNLIILNWLFLLCCVPVFTIGAGLAGMHRVLLEMIRGEDGAIVASFFRGARENFRQATALWMLLLGLGLAAAVDVLFVFQLLDGALAAVVLVSACVMSVLLLVELIYAFPLMARYEAGLGRTMKNALLLGLANLPNTLIALAATLAAPYLCLRFPDILPAAVAASMFILFSGVAGLCDLLVHRAFMKMTAPER